MIRLLMAACISLGGCVATAPAAAPRGAAAPAGRASPGAFDITAAELLAHIEALSADAMAGRGIGEPGLQRATEYQARLFREWGLKPAFGDSYLQPFSLLGSKPDPAAEVQISSGGGATDLKNGEHFVVGSFRQQCPRTVEAELVYAGHLIQATERGWDDVKGADLKGKVLLVEVNEPGNRPGGIFEGEVMTYYGRWTYKFEQASRLGALGILLIHNDKKATYGWDVVRNSWSAEGFVTPDRVPNNCFQGWISEDRAREAIKRAGRDPAALRASAEGKGFRPVPLGATARVRQRPTFRQVQVQNMAGMVQAAPGGEPDRTVVFTAHHDHLGVDPTLKGDQIYNGAVDNCSASAVMLALARHFAMPENRPPINVIFLAPTAEEEGLLGSAYFVAHPPVPLSGIVANLNLELTNVWGQTEDVTALGARHSTLGPVLRQAAVRAGLRYAVHPPDLDGFFYRSDQISFARAGVPAVWLAEGPTATGADPARVQKARAAYKRTHYHRVTDEVKPDWDLSGAVQIASWARQIVLGLAAEKQPPRFYQQSGFARAGQGAK